MPSGSRSLRTKEICIEKGIGNISWISSLPQNSLISHAPRPHTFSCLERWERENYVHVPQCPLFGSHSKTLCKCPTRLAAGTVDNIIGKLRAIFTSTGRKGPWNSLFGSGNPACVKSVKEYLHFITKEQAAVHVSPKQALRFLCFSTNCPNSFVTSSLRPFHPVKFHPSSGISSHETQLSSV